MRSLLILIVVFAVIAPTSSVVIASDQTASPEDGGNPLGNLLFPKEPNYNLPPVQPNITMFVFTLVLFVGFIFVMRSVAWKPLIAGLNAREARVINAEQAALEAKREAEKLQADTVAQLAATQERVKELIAQARSKAEAEKLAIVSQAEQEAQKIKAEALAAIEAAKSDALEELSRTIDEQVGIATEHVVGRRL